MFKIGFIGASKTGTVLGRYFNAKGLTIVGFYSINKESIQETINLIGCKSYTDLNQLVSLCDIVFITTKDDKIAMIWEQIDKKLLANKLICHCSGLLTSDIFKSNPGYSASCHPMSSFNDKNMDILNLQNVNFAVEGSTQGLKILKQIFFITNNAFILLDKNKKIQYHIACVTMTSFYIGLLSFAKNLFKDAIIEENVQSNKLLTDFTAGIIQKIVNGQSTNNIVTGPLVRGDINTLNQHLNVLQGEDKLLYQLLSKQILQTLSPSPINNEITNLILRK